MKKKQGLALLSHSERKRIARMGGLAVSENKKWMSKIGKRGGKSLSKDREHMRKIGKEGGNKSALQRIGEESS